MKNPLQTLLIVLALGLCGLCSWQWYSQVVQQRHVEAVIQQNYDQTLAIQGYTNSMTAMDRQIGQLDARLTELRDLVKSNNVTIHSLKGENGRLTNLLDQYSNAVVQLQAQLKLADDGIRRQNEAVKKLVEDRDEYVKRLNQSIKERNDIVAKYNDLMKQMEAMQAAPQPRK